MKNTKRSTAGTGFIAENISSCRDETSSMTSSSMGDIPRNECVATCLSAYEAKPERAVSANIEDYRKFLIAVKPPISQPASNDVVVRIAVEVLFAHFPDMVREIVRKEIIQRDFTAFCASHEIFQGGAENMSANLDLLTAYFVLNDGCSQTLGFIDCQNPDHPYWRTLFRMMAGQLALLYPALVNADSACTPGIVPKNDLVAFGRRVMALHVEIQNKLIAQGKGNTPQLPYETNRK